MTTPIFLTISVDALNIYRTLLQEALLTLDHTPPLTDSGKATLQKKIRQVRDLLTEDIQLAEAGAAPRNVLENTSILKELFAPDPPS